MHQTHSAERQRSSFFPYSCLVRLSPFLSLPEVYIVSGHGYIYLSRGKGKETNSNKEGRREDFLCFVFWKKKIARCTKFSPMQILKKDLLYVVLTLVLHSKRLFSRLKSMTSRLYDNNFTFALSSKIKGK